MDAHIAELEKHITGNVVTANDDGYETLRKTIFNPDARPAVVVQVANTADVAAAIRFARDNKLSLSVRSGGHNGAGLSTNTDGVVIDLALLNTVEVLDEAGGLVRIGTGGRWGEVAEQLHGHGLAVSSGDTESVGVGGLTLGGGIGWMVRKYGLTIDNVVGAEIVTADGETRRLSAGENQDLFWAIRGGSGNFGVVTSFDIHAQHITDIFGGTISYDFADAQDVLSGFSGYMRTAPEELSCIANIGGGFQPGMEPQVSIMVCYAGDDEQAANKAIDPLLSLGKVLDNGIKKKPYHDMLEEIKELQGIKIRVTNGYLKKLDDEVIKVIASHYGKKEHPIIQIRALGGAMNRVAPDATAFGYRDKEALLVVPSFAPADLPEAAGEQIAATAWAPVKPFVAGAYLNFFTDEKDETVARAFPPQTLERLAKIKAEYDPQNIFNQTANIKPAK